MTLPLPGTDVHVNSVHESVWEPNWSVTCIRGLNVAVTEVSAFIVTVHAPVPEHAPPHPPKL
jgi:hypothetical protein